MLNNMKKPLFVFEMANNHMGDVEHGIRIVNEFKKVKDKFTQFDFAFKLQLRDKTIIHPDYRDRMDIKTVKRFTETRLSEKDFTRLKDEVKKAGFFTMCTPFDEPSVEEMDKIGFDIYKVASCSFADWPLMEKIVQAEKPIIISTGGGTLNELDNMVIFFKNRKKDFALMHCVTAYPTKDEDMQLGQIDFLRKRYEGLTIGFSTHENPDSTEPVKLAAAKGAMIFEKHVGVPAEEYKLNAYSAVPAQAEAWIEAAARAFTICGSPDERMEFTKEAQEGVRKFMRGVFASGDIAEGERVTKENTFLALPNFENQMTAKNLSKYTEYTAKKPIKKNEPVIPDDVAVKENREEVFNIVKKAVGMLKEANIAVPNGVKCSISAHYGLEKFAEYGLVMIDILNREYCKKLLIMFPGQKHPEHAHKIKEETFHILSGDFTVDIDGKKSELKKGDLLTVARGQKHSFSTKNGVIIEEISTTHMKDDSYYTDEAVANNKHRKIEFSLWLDTFEEPGKEKQD